MGTKTTYSCDICGNTESHEKTPAAPSKGWIEFTMSHWGKNDSLLPKFSPDLAAPFLMCADCATVEPAKIIETARTFFGKRYQKLLGEVNPAADNFRKKLQEAVDENNNLTKRIKVLEDVHTSDRALLHRKGLVIKELTEKVELQRKLLEKCDACKVDKKTKK